MSNNVIIIIIIIIIIIVVVVVVVVSFSLLITTWKKKMDIFCVKIMRDFLHAFNYFKRICNIWAETLCVRSKAIVYVVKQPKQKFKGERGLRPWDKWGQKFTLTGTKQSLTLNWNLLREARHEVMHLILNSNDSRVKIPTCREVKVKGTQRGSLRNSKSDWERERERERERESIVHKLDFTLSKCNKYGAGKYKKNMDKYKANIHSQRWWICC